MKNVSSAIETSFKQMEDSVFTFFIDKNFPAFEGHFPGSPLLPGIVQIEIALFCIRKLTGNNVSLSGIKKTKFVKPVLPDSEINVLLSESNGSWHITIKDEKNTYSQMSMRVA